MHSNGWRLAETVMRERIAAGLILFGPDHTTTPRFKRLLSDMDRQAVRPTILQERAPASDALIRLLNGKFFDYPKDVDVLSTWFNAVLGGDREAIVMDFFAGSGSTGHAVMELNAADHGTRKYILVQLDESPESGSAAAQRGYDTIAAVARERLRRAGSELTRHQDAEETRIDTGFRALRIDTTNMTDTLRSPDVLTQGELAGLVDNVKPERTGEDLLFQVMLDWGLELSLPITREEFDGSEVFSVDDGALLASFSHEVSPSLINDLAARAPLRVVFRDSAFANDSARINAEQVFAEVSPSTDVKVI